MVKKLKYLLFLFPFLFIDNVYANTYQLTFSSLVGAGTSYPIVSNNNQSIAYDVPFSGNVTNYEWTTTNSPTCSSTAVVSGIIYLDNTNFGINNDEVGWGRVYIRPNSNSGATNCSIQVADNGTRYVCTSSSLSSNFIIGYTLNPNTPQTTLNHVITRNVDINCDTSTGQIIDNQNANTQNIINNQNSTTNQIIQNNEQNTQDIINNQNQNTQQEIESQQICTMLDSSYYKHNGYISENGGVTSSTGLKYSDYIPLTSSSTLKLIIKTINSQSRLCFYSSNNQSSVISCLIQGDLTANSYITIPSNANYFRATYNTSQDRPIWQLCNSGNQVLNDSLNDLNDTLNDTSQPNTNQDINDMNDMVASDTPISDLITMPLTLINAYINGVNSSCSPVNLGNLYGTDLILPCIDLEQKLGSNLWHIIDSFFTIFMCYNIGMLFVSAFDGITSLRDDFEGLYQPRHADTGYVPKHGGGN